MRKACWPPKTRAQRLTLLCVSVLARVCVLGQLHFASADGEALSSWYTQAFVSFSAAAVESGTSSCSTDHAFSRPFVAGWAVYIHQKSVLSRLLC